MSQIETVSQEIEPTFWRLAKISLSQYWRLFLFFFLIFALVLSIQIKFYALHANPLTPMIKQISDTLLLQYGGVFLFNYVAGCLLFMAVIGKSYKDFTLSFSPQIRRKMPGYWPAISHVSWTYCWRISILYIGFDLIQHLFPQTSKIPNIVLFSTLLQFLIGTLLLRFVVNQQYGNVRLSLLKREA